MELIKEKRGHFWYCLFCLKDFFKHFCFISMYSVLNTLSIHFQNIYTFTYQKSLLHTHFCLFFKSSGAFSISLRWFKAGKSRGHFNQKVLCVQCTYLAASLFKNMYGNAIVRSWPGFPGYCTHTKPFNTIHKEKPHCQLPMLFFQWSCRERENHPCTILKLWSFRQKIHHKLKKLL